MASDTKRTVLVTFLTIFSMELGSRFGMAAPLTSDTTQCAFTMAYNFDEISSQKTMLFSKTITNLGNHYDATKGVFTAPVNGVYMFHLTVTTYKAGDYIDMSLRVNRNEHEEVANLIANDKDGDDQSSVSAVVSLNAGDVVDPYVYKITGSSYALDHNYSTFSGYLLKAQ